VDKINRKAQTESFPMRKSGTGRKNIANKRIIRPEVVSPRANKGETHRERKGIDDLWRTEESQWGTRPNQSRPRRSYVAVFS